MTLQQSSPHPSEACITEIDINRPARALAVLRISDYLLVIVCGFGAMGMVPALIQAAIGAQWIELAVGAAMFSVLAFAVYTGWRHVGVIDPDVWHSHLLIFPCMAAVAVVFVLTSAVDWMSQGVEFFADVEAILTLSVALYAVAVAIPGFVCLLILRSTRVAPMGVRLDELITGLTARAEEAAPHVTNLQRVDVRRGIAYGLAGAAVLLGGMLAPVPTGRQATTVLRVIEQLNILGFFLVVRARRYFQVSADSLLATDKRPPVLFLRSFADDQRQQYMTSQRSLLDFSLETRLANHFYRFGPFIAIGSPDETVPQPGAARVQLSNDEWQSRVLGWMKDSSLIIMYCGTTHWVNWELRRVVDSDRTTSLILMFPETKVTWRTRHNRDIEERVEQVRDVFRDTPWAEELTAFTDFAGLRAMIFRADGSMVMVKCRSRSREAYHLAALIAHQQLLDGTSAPLHETAAVDRPWLGRAGKAAAALFAGAIGGMYLLGLNANPQLTFKQGVLLYAEPVSREVATSVGEYLVRQQFFTDEKATTVQLLQEQGIYRLRFVIDPAHANDLLPNIEFGRMGSEISREVLHGQSMEVAMYDPHLQPVKTVAASRKLTFGKGELYFTEPIVVDEASAVGEALRLNEFFGDDREVSVHLGREEDAYQLRFAIDESRAADPAIVEGFSELAAAVAVQALGGRPVVVHLCDRAFRTLRRERVDRVHATVK
jgi:hypothetical protein